MRNLREQARIAARSLFPKKDWGPIDAWDDLRYDSAFRKNRTKAEELEAQHSALQNSDLSEAPLFSVITPLYNTPADYLDDLIQSLRAQTYEKFEIILVNASPESTSLKQQIQAYEKLDNRIKPITLETNLGITENTNQGIAAATGDFICFIDHDDWIEPDTLFEFAAAIINDPEIDMLYCDEDIVVRTKTDWRYIHPFFKAAFSPEHLLCTNYIIHLLTVRKKLVDSLPLAGREFDGSQDYNLTLKVSEVARHVHHIPKVLYHWRMGENSTAANITDKPYAKRANRIAIHDHLKRTMPNTTIIGSGIVSLHNIWFKPSENKKISLIVDATSGATAFVEAFQQVNTYSNYELILINCPEKYSAETKIQTIGISPSSNRFELFNNATKYANGDFYVFFSADCQYCSPEPLEQIIGMLQRNGVGIVGPRTLYADLSVKSFGLGVTAETIMPLYRGYERTDPGYHCNNRVFENVSAVSWQGLSISRELFDKLDGFDTLLHEEICAADFCRRARLLNQRIVASCTVELSTGDWPKERRFDPEVNRPDFGKMDLTRFYQKWPEMRDSYDPYWNPCLNQLTGYPSINPTYLNGSKN